MTEKDLRESFVIGNVGRVFPPHTQNAFLHQTVNGNLFHFLIELEQRSVAQAERQRGGGRVQERRIPIRSCLA